MHILFYIRKQTKRIEYVLYVCSTSFYKMVEKKKFFGVRPPPRPLPSVLYDNTYLILVIIYKTYKHVISEFLSVFQYYVMDINHCKSLYLDLIQNIYLKLRADSFGPCMSLVMNHR